MDDNLVFLNHVRQTIESVSADLRKDNDAAMVRRLDRLQAELTDLMMVDLDAVVDRGVAARNAALVVKK